MVRVGLTRTEFGDKMPFAITRLPDEPIVIVLIEVPLEQHLDSAKSVNTQLATLVKQSNSAFYILFDLTDQGPFFSDILLGMDMLAAPDSWIMQPQARGVLVGSHSVLRLAVKRFKQQLSVDLQHYQTMEEALANVRAQIASKR